MLLNKRVLTVFYLMIISFTLFSEEQKIIHNYIKPGEDLKLAPERNEIEGILDFFHDSRPQYAVEMYYEFPKLGDVDWNDLYKRLRGLSRLEDVVYFSERSNEYKKMFPAAYFIQSPRKSTPVPDFPDGYTPQTDSLFAYLEEVVLGGGTYEIDYHVKDDSMGITLRNIENLRKMFLKIVGKNNLYISFFFYQEEGKLKVYLFGAYTLENELILNKILKYPYSTLAKRAYTIFVALIGDFQGSGLAIDFPEYLRE